MALDRDTLRHIRPARKTMRNRKACRPLRRDGRNVKLRLL